MRVDFNIPIQAGKIVDATGHPRVVPGISTRSPSAHRLMPFRTSAAGRGLAR